MKVSKVLFAYLGFTLLYFIIASLLFDSDVNKDQNILIQILSLLGNALYWGQVYFYYLLVLFLSSGIGMYYSRGNRPVFVTFKTILITSLAVFFLSVIASNF